MHEQLAGRKGGGGGNDGGGGGGGGGRDVNKHRERQTETRHRQTGRELA